MNKNKPTLFIALWFVILCLGARCLVWAQAHRHVQKMPYKIRYRERGYWQMPRRVIESIGAGEGMTVADVACGDGYFTLLIAERVGASGQVYAEDIDGDALKVLEERRDEAGVRNVTIIHGQADDPMLPINKIDLALIVNSIHLIRDLKTFLDHIRRSLTPGGRLVIIQWAAEKMDSEAPEWDPENRKLFTLSTSMKRIHEARFEVVDFINFLPVQYIFICEP